MPLIAFDARNVRAEPSGIGRVAQNIVRRIANIDKENEYLLIQRSDLPTPIVSDPQFKIVHYPFPIASLRNYLSFGRCLQRLRPTVYHSLHSFLPFGLPKRLKTVVTVHDFNWLQRPSMAGASPWRGWVSGLHGRPMHAHTARVADHLVCGSQQTKNDLLDLFPNTTQPTSVIYHGADHMESTTSKISKKIRRFKNTRFVLSVGSGRPTKNPEATLGAFARIKRDGHHRDVRLLMAGRIDRPSRLQRLAQKNGIGDQVDFIGVVSDAELTFLMRWAQLLSFPSLWEGFGLPVIEAFAAGCPVIAANIASLKEIATGAAWMIQDPRADEEIAQAMTAIIGDEAIRKKMRRDSLQKAEDFTWDKAAQSYISIYRQLLQETPQKTGD